MAELYCPNCGDQMEKHRTDRQPAGRREVILQWMLCPRCRHVGLKSWSFANSVLSGSIGEHMTLHAETLFARSRPGV